MMSRRSLDWRPGDDELEALEREAEVKPAEDWLKEHKRDFRNDMDHSALVVHARQTSHVPNWNGAIILTKCKSKGLRNAT